MRRLSRRSVHLALAAAALALSATLPTRADAQRQLGPGVRDPDSPTGFKPRTAAKKGFNLFGSADAAYSDLKSPSVFQNSLANCGEITNCAPSGNFSAVWTYEASGTNLALNGINPTNSYTFLTWAWGT